MAELATPGPTAAPRSNRRAYSWISILTVFFIIGLVLGLFLSGGAPEAPPPVDTKEATLLVQVQNDTGMTQDVRILVNNGEAGMVTAVAGQTVTATPIQVGWTDTVSGVYEVTVVPTAIGLADTDRVLVADGQTVVVGLVVT